MRLDVAFYWNELPNRDLSRSAVVVADVLRATTVMTLALANGATAVIPQDNDEKARRLYAEMKARGEAVLLCGEKEGFKREGYDLGNSPLEFAPDRVDGKTIIHLTTNGTRALVAASQAKEIYLGSFLNLSAVARRLRAIENSVESVIGVVSGREGNYCLEDTVCLEGVLSALLESPGWNYEITDAARTAIDLFQIYKDRLLDMVRICYHGRYLEEVGLGNDLPECVKVDAADIAPGMKDGRIMVERSPFRAKSS
jgi:2-phosphosulfolactate phosphatase